MALFWDFMAYSLVLILVVLIAAAIWVGHVEAERKIGRETARRNLHHTIPWVLLSGFSLVFVISLLGRYSWVIFCIIFVAAIGAELISWFLKKQKAGPLLADLGKTSQNKSDLWIGLFSVAVAVFQTWFFFTLVPHGTPESTSLKSEIFKLFWWWFSAVHFTARGLDKLEFRENGICFMGAFVRWQRINSYAWESDKPNVLTIRFKPRFPLLLGLLSITIPEQHKHVVSDILNERLPDKNL
jgi:hypothetical protein